MQWENAVARIKPLDPADAPEDLQKLLEAMPPINIIRTVALAQNQAAPFLRFGTSVLTEQTLSAKLRELAILRVARLSHAEYEWVQHVPIALDVGATQEQVDALEADRPDAPCFDEQERAVLDYTTDVVHNVGAGDASHAAVAAFLSDREIIELVIAVGFYMLVARVMECSQIDLDPPVGPSIIQKSAAAARQS